MTTSQMSEFLQHLRRAALLPDAEGLTDGQLLEGYLSGRDEAALEALVHRHGPMVWGVCRRVLRDYHDAEDAFQATFLVLVRKAASVTPRGMVANWIYGVAHQTALKARATAARRKGRERQVAEMPEPLVTQPDLWNDLEPLLDEELSRLPDRYRAVLVLCDLDGKTRKDAARQLGCPEGTVAGRLARARVMLAKRLARRGVALSGWALAATLSQQAASAGVPTSVVSSTIKAATLYAAGQLATTGAISVNVAALTEGVLRAMFLTKLKTVSVVLLVVVALSGAVGLIYQAQAADRPRPPEFDTRKGAQRVVLLRAAADRGKKPARAERLVPRDEDKPRAEDKPIVAQEDAHVRTVAWSANGKLLATIGVVYEVVDFTDADGNPTGKGGVIPHSTIKLWDATTGKLKRSLGEEKDTYLAAITFSADGKTAAVSASKHILTRDPENPLRFETEVRVVDAQTWELKHKVKGTGFASALAFSPDGTRLALGGRSRLADDAAFVRLWDVRKEKSLGGTEGGGYRVSCLAFSGDGKRLAAGDENGKVRVFDGLTGAARQDFEGHGPLRSGGEQCVTGVGFSHDGKTLVSGSMDNTLKQWDVEAGKLLRKLEGNKAPVTGVAVSPDGKLFATAGAVQREGKCESVEVLLWDMETGKLKKALPDQTARVNALAFSPDGSTLAVGAGDGFYGKGDTEKGRAQTPGEVKLWKLR